MTFLAAESSDAAIKWSAVLVGLVVMGFAGAVWVKRRLLAEDEPGGGGLTLSDLRKMRQSGKMTEEEFVKAKALIIGTSKAQSPKPPEPPSAL